VTGYLRGEKAVLQDTRGIRTVTILRPSRTGETAGWVVYDGRAVFVAPNYRLRPLPSGGQRAAPPVLPAR
jgi:hypothetical protein